jgi:lipopolysaccharide/colanic/teichoic acid biosynthesis glycosyltransferase
MVLISRAAVALRRERTVQRRTRRTLDIVLCLLVAPLLLAVGFAVALCVFVDSPGPVLYRSTRVGRYGKPFAMLKFRSMRHGATGPAISIRNDERFTPFGRVLALSRLDELPQIVNVLRGQMLLVGPRPEMQEFVDAHAEAYAEILQTPPGLTGPAQLRFCGEGRLLAGSPDRVALYREHVLPEKVIIDVDYVRRVSLRRDAGLLLRTGLLPMRLSAEAYRAWRSHGRPALRAGAAAVLTVATAAMTILVSLGAAGVVQM